MSLYGEYIKERLGDEILEKEVGFATYRFIEKDGVKCVYLIDLYVRPDFRNAKVASDIADEVVVIAKERGCTRLLGTVSPSAKNATDSLRVLLGYGMSIYQCSSDVIIFKKEI